MAAGGAVLVPETSIAGERAEVLPDVLIVAVWAVSLATIPVLLFLMPNGHFVPNWSWVPAIAVLAAWVSFAFVDHGEEPEAVHLVAAIGLLAFGIGAQVYRYRRASTVLERQQLKWLGVGLFGWFGSLIVYVVGDEVGVLDPTMSGLGYPLGYLLYGAFITAANGLFVFAGRWRSFNTASGTPTVSSAAVCSQRRRPPAS